MTQAVRARANPRSAARRQGGIMLILCLVLLMVVSLAVAMAVRRAVSGDQTSQALRSRSVAFQAAETALRFCESEVLRGAGVRIGGVLHRPLPSLDNEAPSLWRDRRNWLPSSGLSIELAGEWIDSPRGAADPPRLPPRCMVESLRLPSDDGAAQEAYVVTAIGFSADHQASFGTGPPESGSEVWLQSTLIR
ncbi:MAG: hypothetical protein EOO24_00820 [Comamonadaceae bacterium]|nr:MAG: hypothetical protein EOO24_00820 [Comamonadaceae bacterium]